MEAMLLWQRRDFHVDNSAPMKTRMCTTVLHWPAPAGSSCPICAPSGQLG
jgi:hypothetical protein